MNIPAPLIRMESAEGKVRRAKEHLADLITGIRDYLSTNPYVISTRRDPETRRLIYFLSEIRPLPVRVSAIIGDIINNLRSALDHLAYQLVWVAVGRPPDNHVYFPIADDHQKYAVQSRRQLKGACPTALSAVDLLKPYRGGNDLLWQLHKLNNVDKHRVLLTSGSAYQSFNIGPMISRQIPQIFGAMLEREGNMGSPKFDLFLKPEDRLFPLKVGDELFSDLPDAEPDSKIQFRFSVGFGEPGILFDEPIVETLSSMLTCIEAILVSFKIQLQ